MVAPLAPANRAGLAPANDAWLALALVAIDPAAAGGVVVRAQAGPVRDRFVADLRRVLGPQRPWRVVPTHADADRLLGGIDLAATLRTGRRVAERGLLAEADGGVVVLSMAERASRSTVAHLTATMDVGVAVCARHGVESRDPARFGVVAFDESDDAERDDGGGRDAPGIDPSLCDRLAFVVDLRTVALRDADAASALWRDASANRDAAVDAHALESVDVADDLVEALCAAALALGVDAPRASLQAVRVARLAAALHGRNRATADDAALAARLVLAPRATQMPARAAPPESTDDTPPDPPVPADAEPDRHDAPEADAEPEREPEADARTPTAGELDALVLAAAAAAIPPGLLAGLVAERAAARGRGGRGGGRAGELRRQQRRGRPLGSVRGDLRRGRLDLVATLRAAAPWQRLRRREADAQAAEARTEHRTGPRVRVRADDVRIGRYAERTRTTTIFAVDASGSAALHRLGEAKGAVELLLADCYVRRDSVAVLGFRGATAELLLPPTRSLARAKRALAELPGGGGTPLAAALDAARELASAVRRRGDTPLVVVLSDGRANVARDGSPGRPRAEADALAAARAWRDLNATALFVDTSPQPSASARAVAAALGARYLPLPHADARAVSQVVQAATRAARPSPAAR